VSKAISDHDGRLHAALVRLLGDLRVAGPGDDDPETGSASILASVCRYTEWPVGHAYRFDRESARLRPTMIRHERPPARHGALLDATAHRSLAPGEDLPGLAMSSRRPRWTRDITRQRRFAGVESARDAPVRGAVAVPVMVGGDVIEVLEFFCSESQAGEEDVLTVLTHVATDWGRSLERRSASKLTGVPRVAERRRAAAEEFRLHGAAAAHVRDAIVVSTAGGFGRGPAILYVNAAFTRMTGYTEGDVLGQSFSLLAGARTSRPALQVIYERFRRGLPVSDELIAYRKNGHEFLLHWHALPIFEADGGVEHFASIQRDVTAERSERQALRRADRDTLTGLPTRDVMEKRIRLSIGRARERPEYRFALLFLDMDGFKAVNDQHGHVVGDQLLASAARRLESAIRPGDALARFGGDEFVMLLHAVTDIRDVTMVADRVQERMAAPFEIQGITLSIAASIGIALSGPAYRDSEELIRDADAAMYEAKRRGCGGIEFFGRSPDGWPGPALTAR